MSELSIAPPAGDDAKMAGVLQDFGRRILTTPPGMCPLALQLSFLQTSLAQTCGKCVPCRDGLPQLAGLLKKIVDCEADQSDLDALRVLAETIRDGSDCAIGYDAAQQVLSGLEQFAGEYKSHIEAHHCQKGVAQTVPCETGCPAHVNVPGYIALVADGDCAGAVQMVRKDNPFPTACAYICEHPCEERCRRRILDAPINIRGIKKFAVDTLAADQVPTPVRLPDTGRRVAVIGAGPSGMTCAYYLALMGHQVDLFEEKKLLGGMMRYGIPAYRFPRKRLDEDIQAILGVGNITVHAQTHVDGTQMRTIFETFDAVYVSIGAHAGKKLRIPGMDAAGVMSAVEILRGIGDGHYPDFTGKRVAVIGGGNVAMDCARSAVRCNASEVSVIYRRRLEDMTAQVEEVRSAAAEGVEMLTLMSPVSIETNEQGEAKAVIVQPQKIGAYSRGRPAPENADKAEERIEADIVLVAIGQDIVTADMQDFGLTAQRGRLVADASLRAQGFDKIFVGGDCESGPTTVIKAIGAGKVAARNIDRFLGFNHTLDCGVQTPAAKSNHRTQIGRVNVAERPVRLRRKDFDCVEIEMSQEEALQECGRCLRCDHFGCGSLVGGRVQYV